jgi:hypothetical protein
MLHNRNKNLRILSRLTPKPPLDSASFRTIPAFSLLATGLTSFDRPPPRPRIILMLIVILILGFWVFCGFGFRIYFSYFLAVRAFRT